MTAIAASISFAAITKPSKDSMLDHVNVLIRMCADQLMEVAADGSIWSVHLQIDARSGKMSSQSSTSSHCSR